MPASPGVKPTVPYSRLRTSGTLSAPSSVYEVAAGQIANYTQLRWYNSPQGRTAAMQDIVVPGFTRRKAAGEVLFNPMARTETSYNGSTTTGSVDVIPSIAPQGQKYTITGDWVSYLMGGVGTSNATQILSGLLPVPLVDPSQVTRAISEACTKAQRLPSEANLLVSMAELQKTMRLVPDLWSNWSRFFQSFHGKVDYRYGRHLVANPRYQSAANLEALRKITQDTWLAMRFGVRPLIMDTIGVVKALERELSPDPVRITQRGIVAVSGSQVVTSERNSGVVAVTVMSSYSQNIGVRAMSLFEFEADKIRNRIGMSIGHVPEAVIDLVSYSFVANWMITLNEYFSAIGTAIQPGVKSLGGCYVITDERSAVHQLVSARCTDPSYTLGSSPSGVGTSTSRTKERIVGLKSPSISIRANPFKFLTDWRLLDATALLSKSIRRPIRF